MSFTKLAEIDQASSSVFSRDVSAGGWMLSELLRRPADSQFQKLAFTSDRCAVGRSQAAGPCQLPARSWPQHDKQTPEALSHCWLKPIRWLIPGLEAGNESRRRTNQIEKPSDGKAPPGAKSIARVQPRKNESREFRQNGNRI